MYSNWTPKSGRFAALDLYIDKCRHEISKLDLQQQSRMNNLTLNEKKALLSLRNNPDIVIKPADKGGAVVVWCKDLYVEEGYRQLSDANSYTHLTSDPTAQHQATITSTIRKLNETQDLPATA